MTTEEIKSEIQKSLDKVPDNTLEDVLGFLKLIENKASNKLHLIKNLSEILNEDNEVLQRLAK